MLATVGGLVTGLRRALRERRLEVREQGEWMADACEIVVEAAQHHRAAEGSLALDDLLTRQPMHAEDAFVECAGPDGG